MSHLNSMLPLTLIKDCVDTTDYHLVCQQHPLSSKEPWKGCFKEYPKYTYDILITRTSDEEHLTILDQVLSLLEKAGLRLKQQN